jgi:hypothetical protein
MIVLRREQSSRISERIHRVAHPEKKASSSYALAVGTIAVVARTRSSKLQSILSTGKCVANMHRLAPKIWKAVPTQGVSA